MGNHAAQKHSILRINPQIRDWMLQLYVLVDPAGQSSLQNDVVVVHPKTERKKKKKFIESQEDIKLVLQCTYSRNQSIKV